VRILLQGVRLPRDVIPVSALLYAGACRTVVEGRCRSKNKGGCVKELGGRESGGPTDGVG
jgi:hypothetical protein